MRGKTSTAASALGLLQAAHPFPLVAVLSLTALIGVASAGDDLDGGRLVRVLLAMLFAQLVIGWSNDYSDRDDDALHQPWKPIPAGRVSANALRPAMLIAGVAAMLVAAPLGLVPEVCVAIGMGSGLAYNFALKPTPWSWLPFVVAFCVLPPYVWAGLDVWDGAFLALYPIALPLTVAAHLANALPDLQTDREAGRSSLVVRLGRTGTLRLLAVALVAPVVLAMQSVAYVSYDVIAFMGMTTAYGALFIAIAAVYALGRGRRQFEVWGFRLVVVASLVFVGGWLGSVE